MGTDMSSIQVAYQGFAKQNYTMLDNLKLGYGGTQEEMFRLLQTAASLNSEFANTANFSIDSSGHLEAGYADIVQAIHIVQENMGITGTTAAEAEHTIKGSLDSVKAAWENLLTGIAGGGGEFDKLVDNFVQTLVGEGGQGGALQNLVPRIQTTLQGIGKLVEALAPVIADELPGLAESIVPAIGQSALSMVMAFGRAIYENTPKLLDYGAGLLESLSDGLAEGVPAFLENALPMLVEFSEGMREKAGVLVDAGLNLLKNLAQGIADGLPALIENIPQIVTNIANIINDNAPKILAAGVQIILTLIVGIIKAIPTLIANLPKIIEAIFAVIRAVNWVSLGGNIVSGIGNGIKAFAKEPLNAIRDLFSNIISFISNPIQSAYQWGVDLINNFAGGIIAKARALFDTVRGIAQGIRDFLGFSEPKKGPLSNFHTYAPDMIKLFVKGIKDNAGLISEQLEKSISLPMSDMVSYWGDAVDELEDFDGPTLEPDVMDTTRSVQSYYVPDKPNTVANIAQMGYNGGNMMEVIPGPLNQPAQQRDIITNLYLERDKLAHAIYTLYNEEAQRVGLNLVGVN